SGKRSLPLPSASTEDGQAKRLRAAAIAQQDRSLFASTYGYDVGEGSSSSFQMSMSIPGLMGRFDPQVAYIAVCRVLTNSAQAQATVPLMTETAAAASSSRAQANRRRSASCHALRTDSCSLGDLGLAIPSGLTAAEQSRRKDALQSEIDFHKNNPPILPPSKVEDLPPKPFIEDFLRIPEDITEEERRDIEDQNNRIAAQHQLIDRQRNNQAAKKSRQARLESLWNTRELLNAKSAECFWFRMKVIALGGSTEEWDQVTASVKARLVKEIDSRVKDSEKQAADAKKAEEAKKRAERNKRRAEVRSREEE
ncbi:hypothetical protein BBK36DRAFT_1083407, partial [Trichoderma citrinoviride]